MRSAGLRGLIRTQEREIQMLQRASVIHGPAQMVGALRTRRERRLGEAELSERGETASRQSPPKGISLRPLV